MADYIRTKIKYVGSGGHVIELGELSVAVWGEPNRLVKQIVQHYKLPDGDYDLYLMGERNKPIKNMNSDEVVSIMLIPVNSGPLIME